MRSVFKIAAATAAFGLVLSSTAASAAAPAPAQAVAQPQAPNAWLMLSALGPTRSVALGGAAAAAQPADGPPLPTAAYAGNAVISGELIGIVLWLALIAVAVTAGGSSSQPQPNTPS